MIDIFISDTFEDDNNQYNRYFSLPKIGYCYQTYFESNPYVFMNKQLSFEDVLSYYLNKRFLILNIGNIRFHKDVDACLSLFYNPFFEETYGYVKNHHAEMKPQKLKTICKTLFKELSDPAKKMIYEAPHILGREEYLSHHMYEKSKEILSILKMQ